MKALLIFLCTLVHVNGLTAQQCTTSNNNNTLNPTEACETVMVHVGSLPQTNTYYLCERVAQTCSTYYLSPTTSYTVSSSQQTGVAMVLATPHGVQQSAVPLPFAIAAFASGLSPIITLPNGCKVIDSVNSGGSWLVPTFPFPASIGTQFEAQLTPALVGASVYVQHIITDLLAPVQLNPPMMNDLTFSERFEYSDIIKVTIQAVQ